MPIDPTARSSSAPDLPSNGPDKTESDFLHALPLDQGSASALQLTPEALAQVEYAEAAPHSLRMLVRLTLGRVL